MRKTIEEIEASTEADCLEDKDENKPTGMMWY